MLTLPIVVVAWSPIGYETYLSLCEMCGPDNVVLISARNFDPPEALYSMGTRHDFFLQTPEEIEWACENLTRCVADLKSRGEKFTLCAPQMGNFYTRTLLESENCVDLFIYDEGSAAYFEHFARLQNVIWMRKEVKPNKNLQDYLAVAQSNYDHLKNTYLKGVKFYDFKHPKIRSLLSFFPDAFGNLQKIQIPFKAIELTDEIDQKNDVLILLPSIKKIRLETERQKYITDIVKLRKENSDIRFIVKPHPSDFDVHLDEYQHLMSLSMPIFYDDYMAEKNLNPFREPAVSGFGTIITYNNSTELYIKQLQKINS